ASAQNQQPMLEVRRGTVRSSQNLGSFSFDFSGGSEGPTRSGDVDFEENIFLPVGSVSLQKVNGSFDQLNMAPDSGYSQDTFILESGDVIAFITQEGYYGKLRITSVNTGSDSQCSFEYALQTDRSYDLRTR
ncbi:MAG: hypothetical protein WC352_03220, partial [Candidatus Omnitrophota bacterium]